MILPEVVGAELRSELAARFLLFVLVISPLKF